MFEEFLLNPPNRERDRFLWLTSVCAILWVLWDGRNRRVCRGLEMDDGEIQTMVLFQDSQQALIMKLFCNFPLTLILYSWSPFLQEIPFISFSCGLGFLYAYVFFPLFSMEVVILIKKKKTTNYSNQFSVPNTSLILTHVGSRPCKIQTWGKSLGHIILFFFLEQTIAPVLHQCIVLLEVQVCNSCLDIWIAYSFLFTLDLLMKSVLDAIQDIEYLKLYASRYGRDEGVALLEKTGVYQGPERYTHDHMPVDLMRGEVFNLCRS